jgi:hypothetical protein
MSNTSPFSYLLDLVGIRLAKSDGTSIPQSKTINFKTGISAAYNDSTGEIDVEAGTADITLDQLSLEGRQIACKTTTGTGASDGLILGSNSLAGRIGSADISEISAAQNEFVGRPAAGGLDAYDTNDFEFANRSTDGGTPTLKVAPHHAVLLDPLATAADIDTDFNPGVDGYYQITACAVVQMATAETYHRVSAVVDAIRVSDVLTLVGAQVDLPGGDPTGMTLTFDVDGGNIRVNLANATGETVNGNLFVGWMRSDLVP